MITVFGEGTDFRVVWLLEEMGLPRPGAVLLTHAFRTTLLEHTSRTFE
jgi:hypothetical protein